MSVPAGSQRVPTFKNTPQAASGLVMLIGGLALVGWMFDIEVFKSGLPGLVAMNPVTALSFILAGVSLGLLGMERANEQTRRIGKACASIVGLVGLLKLAEYLFGLEIGIDQVLFRGKLGARGVYPLNRMAPNTAFNFFLLGSALLILDLQTSRRGHRPAQHLTLLAAVVSFLALTGYAYGVKPFYGVIAYIPMALNTAIGFAVLCAGLLFSRPDRGLMAVVTSRHSGGVLARRLLPTMTGVLLLIGWLRLAGQREGLYETAFGTALLVVVSVVILGVLVWISAKGLDRKESERRRAEDERDRFFNLSLDLICIAGFDGYFKQVNSAWETTLGWTRAELLSKPYLEFIHPDDRHVTASEAGKNEGGERSVAFENRYRCKDGSYKWLSWMAMPLKEQTLIYATARDITERKRAAEDVAQLAAIVESSDDAIIGKDLNGVITSWNIGAERLFGYSAGEAVGHPVARLIPSDRQGEEEPIISRIKRGETVEHYETVRIRKDGRLIDVSVTVSPIKNIAGQIVGASKVARDITERKRAEENLKNYSSQLEAVNKELEAFSYSVSHDLRAPLRHIDGFSQILLEDYAGKLDEEGRNYLRRVREASQQMARLIDDLLNLSRVTRSEMRRETVDLSRMAEAAAEALKKTQPDREVEFAIEKGLMAEGDERLLRVALDNLLGNAWKYTGKRPQAHIEFGRTNHGSRLAYFVRDNGAGFDMAYVHKLFGAFQRLHSVSEFPGTGIGLATVQRIVHRHGGQVWAEGAVDKGATFYFTL